MGSRTILYFTLFLAIAGVAGIFARAYFSDQEAEASVEAEPTGPKIIVANRDMDVGGFLTTQDLRWQATASEEEVLISQHFIEGAVALESLLGAVVRRPLKSDQPITIAEIIKPGQRGFLAAVLRPGMRAVTVEIDKVSGNSGLVFPGDHVDLILTVELIDPEDRQKRRMASETILNDVRVIAMGQRVETFASVDAEVDDRPATTATLEVAPEHAERIHVAQNLGKLAMSLRSLADEGNLTEERIIGGVAPEQDVESLRAKMTWAADVSTAVRLQEESRQRRPVGPSGAQAPAPQPLILMRGGDRKTFNPNNPADQ